MAEASIQVANGWGFSVLLKDTFTLGEGELGSNLPIAKRLLYLLNHYRPTCVRLHTVQQVFQESFDNGEVDVSKTYVANMVQEAL